MAEPEADRRYVDEAQEAFGGLVVTGGYPSCVLELVQAPLDEVAQSVELAVNGHAQFPGFPHGDHRHDVARFHGFMNVVRVIATIRQ